MTIAICDDSVIDCLLSKFLISEYFKKRKMTCSIITYETGAKLLSDFEMRDSSFFHFDAFAGSRIFGNAGTAVADRESPKTSEFDSFAFGQS